MRKLLCIIAFVFASPFAASSQTPRAAPPHDHGLTLARPDWVSIAVTVGPVGPVGGTTGGGGRAYGKSLASRHEPPHIHHALANARPSVAPSTGKGWKRSLRHASVALTNDGAKVVKSVRLDFVFTDPSNGAEVNRIHHRSKKRLRPGATATTKKEVMGSARHRRGDGMDVSVEVTEVVYEDGTVWREP